MTDWIEFRTQLKVIAWQTLLRIVLVFIYPLWFLFLLEALAWLLS